MKKILIPACVLGFMIALIGCTSVNTITSTTTSLAQNSSMILAGPMKQTSTVNPIVFDMKMTITSGSAVVWVTDPSSKIVYGKTSFTSGTSTVSKKFQPVSGGGVWNYNVLTSQNVSGDMTISLQQNQ